MYRSQKIIFLIKCTASNLTLYPRGQCSFSCIVSLSCRVKSAPTNGADVQDTPPPVLHFGRSCSTSSQSHIKFSSSHPSLTPASTTKSRETKKHMASIQEQSYQAEKAALTGTGPVLHSQASYRKKWRKSLLVARFTTILLNQKKEFVPHPLSFAEGSKALLFGNRLNILLVFVPLAIASAVTGGSDGLVFSLSCIGLLPLANLLGEATEKVAHHTNDTVGGLLNASFG